MTENPDFCVSKKASSGMIIFIIAMVTLAGIGQLLIKQGVSTFKTTATPELIDNGLFVSINAVNMSGDTPTVTILQNGEETPVEVTTGNISDGKIEITSGIGENHEVIVRGDFPYSLWGFIKLCFYWPTFIGLVIYFIFGVSWLKILADVPVSFAFPFLSIGYIVIIFGTYFLFGENINFLKILAITLIIAGVICLSRSDTAEDPQVVSAGADKP